MPRIQQWLGLGGLVLGALSLIGVGVDLLRIEFPARGGWRLATMAGALVVLGLGYSVTRRRPRRWRLVAVISIVNALAAVYLG
ncbi:MAG: hypothetical protein IT340_12615 [Chloroflexi bacterium]|nr:hypothetical protein [Chloroflexota bacterium]